MSNSPDFTSSILYFRQGRTPSGASHQHSFHQIEYCLAGRIICRCPKDSVLLNPGDYCLLPPEYPHQFLSRTQDIKYLSIKFNCSPNLPFSSGKDTVITCLLDNINRLAGGEIPDIAPFSYEEKILCETYLNGILRHLSRSASSQPPESRFITDIRKCVYEQGFGINVEAMAELTRCSRRKFYYRFKKEYPGLSAKQFMDNILIEMAQKYLDYSAMNITDVADKLNFPSVYAFSRFFKAHCGLSPKQYKQRKNE